MDRLPAELRADGYAWSSPETNCSHTYLLPRVTSLLDRLGLPAGSRLLDLGCGNGYVAQYLASRGWSVVGVDASTSAVEVAKAACPDVQIEQATGYEDLGARFGRFDVVLSLEVIEHVFLPRPFARCIHDALKDSGTAIISTPYHGYWKNLVLALAGKWDDHHTALWDYGHIKFWSVRTLTALCEEAGLNVTELHRVGRVPALAKSMIAVARRQ